MSHRSTAFVAAPSDWTPLPDVDAITDFDTLARSVSPLNEPEAARSSNDTCGRQQLSNTRAPSLSPRTSNDTERHGPGTRSEPVPSLPLENAGDHSPLGTHQNDPTDSMPSHDMAERSNLLETSPSASNLASYQGIKAASPSDDLVTDVEARAKIWLPYTLRRMFLVIMASVSLLLCITLATLCRISVRNDGLRKDDDSISLLVARSYLPTILAVFFTQTLVMISDDIKRTVPFARLARRDVDEISVEHTLMYRPKPWWSTLREGFERSRNSGGVDWVLVFSSLATGVSLLTISTLSSSLLATEHVVIRSTSNFKRFIPSQDGRLHLAPGRETYSHTTSGFLLNASTSMWVSDSRVVLPFGPSNLEQYPDFLPDGEWTAKSTVYQLESSCTTMALQDDDMDVKNMTYTTEVEEYEAGRGSGYTQAMNSEILVRNFTHNITEGELYSGFNLMSEDGCSIQLWARLRSSSGRIDEQGGLLWTNLTSSHVGWKQLSADRGSPPFIRPTEWGPQDDRVQIDFTGECLGRNLLLVTTPWGVVEAQDEKFSWYPGFQVKAELCTPAYYKSLESATAFVSPDYHQVKIDDITMKTRRLALSETEFDLEHIEELSFGGGPSSTETRSPDYSASWAYENLEENLAALYSFNTTLMLSDVNLTAQAAKLRGRFFGELMLSSVTTQQPSVLEDVQALRTFTEQRIVVVPEIAVALCVLLMLLFCYLCYLVWGVSSPRRPLNLSMDPATVFGFATYLRDSPSTSIYAALETGHAITQGQAAESSLSLSQPESDNSQFQLLKKARSAHDSRVKGNAPPGDWRPKVLQARLSTTLFLAYAAIVIALLILRHYAARQALYRSAFIYQIDLRVFKAKLLPYSLIATLIAVGLALWWDAVDRSMRLLQPYLAMSKGPSAAQQAAATSYLTSYWLWAATKAASKRHWLLCMVTVGTTLSQILIVSMAAIFDREPGVFSNTTLVNRGYSIRVEPLTYNHTGENSERIFLQTFMKFSGSNWLYSALDQMTLQTEQPAWSREQWSFGPAELSVLPLTFSRKGRDVAGLESSSGQTSVSNANVTLTTSAIRARLKCDTVSATDSSWYVENRTDFFWGEDTASTRALTDRLNRAGYMLPEVIYRGTRNQTTIYPKFATITCCSNETDDAGRSAVGYWSHLDPDQWWFTDDNEEDAPGQDYWGNGPGPETWPPKFAVKWITGPTVNSNFTAYRYSDAFHYKIMQFTKIPEMTFLSCKPIIEQTNAKVTVAHTSGKVLDFALLGEPEPYHDAWAAHFEDLDGGSGLNVSSQDEYTGKVRFHTATRIAIDCLSITQNSFDGWELTDCSFGTYFLTQLLGASSFSPFSWWDPQINFGFENLQDTRLNIRDRSKGLNMDFMSYSNLFQANMDPNALLDPETLINYTQHTFSTFFQHFASQAKWTDGSMMAFEKAQDGQAEAATTERIEHLAMIPSATWLSLSIIFILMIILATLIVTLKIAYPRTVLEHKIECLADVLALIEGSHGLLSYAEKYDIDDFKNSGLKTRLGWFRDRYGILRWGIEIVDAEGVVWVEKPEGMVTGELAKSVVRSLG